MRVLLIGDGVALTTGFAQVLGHVADALVAAGHEVAQLATADTPPFCDSAPYQARGVRPYWPVDDYIGASVLPAVLADYRPDVCFLVCDPGSAARFQASGLLGSGTPHVLYAPVEGAPVHPILAGAFRAATRAATMTHWSTERLAAEHDIHIPAVYHGADLSLFHPLDITERWALRKQFGWEGKFITAFVGRNNGRKGHDRLLKALHFLPAQHELYLHCSAFDNWMLGGWDLGHLVDTFGVADRVNFPDGFERDGTRGTSHQLLAQALACADLYVHPSKVEGFGIPILEAMASGLPVVIPADHGNMEEVAGDAVFCKIDPVDWDTAHTSAQHASLSPNDIAAAISAAQEQPGACGIAAKRGLERAQLPRFRWETMTAALLPLIEQAAGTTKRRQAVTA